MLNIVYAVALVVFHRSDKRIFTHTHKHTHKTIPVNKSIRTLPEHTLTQILSFPLSLKHITSFHEHIWTVSEQAHTHTHAHTLSHTLCLSPTRTFTQSHTSHQSMKAFEHYVGILSLSPSPFLSQAHAYTLTHRHTSHTAQKHSFLDIILVYPYTHTLSLSFSLSHTHTYTLSHTYITAVGETLRTLFRHTLSPSHTCIHIHSHTHTSDQSPKAIKNCLSTPTQTFSFSLSDAQIYSLTYTYLLSHTHTCTHIMAVNNSIPTLPIFSKTGARGGHVLRCILLHVWHRLYTCMYVYIYIYKYLCVYLCIIYIYIYMYICAYV